ncbi:MAG: tetratricopeptide repeat protein [Bacteroidia bacterium]|nr:tetratricopeptide repeat protein [Bacteroidia bacterium]
MKPKVKNIPKSSVKNVVVKDNVLTIRLMSFTILLLSFIVYANTFKNGYVLDDFSVIKENWVVKRGVESVPTIFKTSYRYGYWSSADDLYRPLSLVMFAAEWQLWPDNPKPGHVINVLLYSLACMLLFLTLRKIFYKFNVFLPFIATIIFALHPVHTEVVANIKSRDEILSFFFLVLTLRFVIEYINSSKKKWLIIGMISYFLAFLSKESAITFLAVIPLVIYFFTDTTIRKNIFITSVMLIPALIFLAIRAKVLANQPEMAFVSSVDNLLVAAPDMITRYATAIKIMGKYLWLLVVPYPLVCDYSFNQIPIVGIGNVWFIISFIVLLSMVIVSVWKFKTKHVLVFSVFFFFITMSLYSNIFMLIGSSFGERFLFVPSLAFSIAVSWLVLKLFKIAVEYSPVTKSNLIFKLNNRLLIVIIPTIIAYPSQIILRNKDWKSNLSLYAADVWKSPNSAHMQYYYGLSVMKDLSLNREGKVVHPEYLDFAIFHFSRAAEIVPTFADAYDQIGLAYYRKNMNDSALKYYQLALDRNPTKSITYSNMGVIYFNNKQFEKALEVYEKAVKYDPAFSDAWMNLGSTLATLGKRNEAINAFKKCVEFKPENALATYFISITYKGMGDDANAKIYLDKAAQLDSKYLQPQ